jgi:hypothetical protein
MTYKTPWVGVLLVAALLVGRAAAEVRFAEHHIDSPGGQRYGQTSLVDVDKDGDLDFISGQSGGDVYWFEYQGPDKWVRHLLTTKVPTDVGGTAIDVDGDGWVDQVSGAAWFRNTGKPREEPFERFDFGGFSTHDTVAADMDGDGRLDLVMMSDKAGLKWFRIPKDPRQKWEPHDIGPGVHGGVAVGDLDGDGDLDVARSNAWFENADGKGTKWVEHANIDFGRPGGSMPFTTRARVLDVNKDGRNDLVIVECDTRECRAAWFENADGKGGKWVMHLIAEKKGDLHSLCVADFDGDGDPDVFSCEGPLSGSGPGGARRWFLWENLDGKGGQWREQVVLEGKEGHEAVAADVDGDGDIDICTKPWKGDEHIYLENLTKRPGGK